MEHEIPFGNSNRENGTTFLDFPLFLGIFQWDEPTKRVPLTAEPEIPEILTKWKAPIISAHNLDCMFYADDSQLYITIDPHDQRPVLNTLQNCICEIIEWNTINKLVCNPSKTKVI